MIRNYFYLNRYIAEAGKILTGAKIGQVFSQEKGKLVIICNMDETEYFLEFSVIPGQSYINLRERYNRAKKNTFDLFSNSIGDKIKSIKIADDDRIIKIECSHSEFYFAIRGKLTNVFYIRNDGSFEAFKTLDDETLKEINEEFRNKTFKSDFSIPDLSLPLTEDYLPNVKKKHPVIGTEIIKEVITRNSNNNFHQKELIRVLKEIEITKPAVFIDDRTAVLNIGFESFSSIPYTSKEVFDDIVFAQNYFFSKRQYLEGKNSRLKLINKHIDKELKKLSNKLNNLQVVVEKGSKEEEYKKLGNLLLVNLNSLKPGINEIEVPDIYENNKKINIKLNPKIPPKKNVDTWFDKSKAERIGFNKSVELIEKTKNDYQKLKRIENSLAEIDSLKELETIIKALKIKRHGMPAEKEDLKSKFKHYIIDNKFNVFVGKDSKNNDLLTTRFAKQNDYWFHARSVSGSHVVLRVENTKEAIPKSVLKKTASLAAYHSKAKTAGTAPVSFTLKKYVIKKKGYPIGTVHLLKEDVLLVKPEIPVGCEYVTYD